MEKQLSIVADFVENDLNQWHYLAKARLKHTANAEENDAIFFGQPDWKYSKEQNNLFYCKMEEY